MVGVTGLEPAAPCSQSTCATKLRYTPSGRAHRDIKYYNKRPPRVKNFSLIFVSRALLREILVKPCAPPRSML